ncbi:MAG: GTP 3',8-cyclase MoaA [Clostridiales bacterium]
MTLTSFNRKIDYLRLSITDKCNFRCRYCMPEEGIVFKDHQNMLRVEEMVRLLGIFRLCGVDKLRITGGEPLVSRSLLPLLEAIRPMNFQDIGITTNGQLLPEMSDDLLKAGIKRVNISLDSLDPEKFSWITRGGNIKATLQGMEAALKTGLDPVKINVVAVKGFNDDQFVDLALLAKDKPLHVRFIELMPIGSDPFWTEENYISNQETKEIISSSLGDLHPYHLKGNGPAEVFHIDDFQGTVGFISAISNHFCANCNRLRLTSDGKIYPCLHHQEYIDLFTPLRQGATDEEILQYIEKAVNEKPQKHLFGSQKRQMSSIGG